MIYIERVRAIKKAAAHRFGFGEDWQFKHIGESTHPQFPTDDPLSWKLEIIVAGKIYNHVLFNLRTDYTEEAIERKFRALEVSYGEYMKFNYDS